MGAHTEKPEIASKVQKTGNIQSPIRHISVTALC
jgi:hypothetical protein